MDLPNILNQRGGQASIAAELVNDQPYSDVHLPPMPDTTGGARSSGAQFTSRTGPQYPGGMTSAPHMPFSMVQNPYPTPTESIDSGYARAQNEEQQVRHMPTSNGGEVQSQSQSKAFACSTCGKSFARRSDLARHERIHSGIRPHVCDFPGCGKPFIQRSALTVHSRVHTGEKPHMCEHCTKPFSDSSSLARHRRIHSGKRPYKCPFADCQKTFTRKTTLTRHKTHHSGTVEESIAATSAALAQRPPGQQGRQRQDGTYSEGGSGRSSPTSDPQTAVGSPSAGNVSQLPHMPRQGSDMGYMTGQLPPHLRADMGSHSPRSGSASPSFSTFGLPSNVGVGNGGRPSFTSHPQMYGGPPAPLEPPTSADTRSQGSAGGSPHMSGVGWQSPGGPGGMGSPIPGHAGYEYAPPYGIYAYGQHPQDMGQRRPQSSEPEAYELKRGPEMWTQQMS